ncbi:hypothetical protein B0H10DRAFT_1962421 [Mycena sp. CBHHK59/15]|nr:hypothetical protein B0H10DRAFT_1962421 [Mycena sp. CBHHK59/15]
MFSICAIPTRFTHSLRLPRGAPLPQQSTHLIPPHLTRPLGVFGKPAVPNYRQLGIIVRNWEITTNYRIAQVLIFLKITKGKFKCCIAVEQKQMVGTKILGRRDRTKTENEGDSTAQVQSGPETKTAIVPVYGIGSDDENDVLEGGDCARMTWHLERPQTRREVEMDEEEWLVIWYEGRWRVMAAVTQKSLRPSPSLGPYSHDIPIWDSVRL